jgi:hypothetical protein
MKVLQVRINDERKVAKYERLFANRRPHLHPVSPELDTSDPSHPTIDSAAARIYGLYLVIYNANPATLRAVLSQPRTAIKDRSSWCQVHVAVMQSHFGEATLCVRGLA